MRYRVDTCDEVLSLDQPCLLIAALAEESGLEIRMRPGWKQFVSEEDQGYASALIEDLAGRAASDPAALFEQLSSLSVGRLVAAEVGDDLAARGDVAILWESFVGFPRVFE